MTRKTAAPDFSRRMEVETHEGKTIASESDSQTASMFYKKNPKKTVFAF